LADQTKEEDVKMAISVKWEVVVDQLVDHVLLLSEQGMDIADNGKPLVGAMSKAQTAMDAYVQTEEELAELATLATDISKANAALDADQRVVIAKGMKLTADLLSGVKDVLKRFAVETERNAAIAEDLMKLRPAHDQGIASKSARIAALQDGKRTCGKEAMMDALDAVKSSTVKHVGADKMPKIAGWLVHRPLTDAPSVAYFADTKAVFVQTADLGWQFAGKQKCTSNTMFCKAAYILATDKGNTLALAKNLPACWTRLQNVIAAGNFGGVGYGQGIGALAQEGKPEGLSEEVLADSVPEEILAPNDK